MSLIGIAKWQYQIIVHQNIRHGNSIQMECNNLISAGSFGGMHLEFQREEYFSESCNLAFPQRRAYNSMIVGKFVSYNLAKDMASSNENGKHKSEILRLAV